MIDKSLLNWIKTNKLTAMESKLEGLIHNLNTPLNTILGYALLGKKKYSNASEFDKISKAALKIDAMLKRLNYIWEMYQIEDKRPFSLTEIIECELDLFTHSLFFKHQVDISFSEMGFRQKMLLCFSDIAMILNLYWDEVQIILEPEEKKIMKIMVSYDTAQVDLTISVNHNKKGNDMKELQENSIFTIHNPIITLFLEPYQASFERLFDEDRVTIRFLFPKE
jgi:signal transduction histidine kinase